jgi:hypothetical protein
MLRAHHARHYGAATTALAVSGKLPPRSQLSRALEQAFAGVAGGARPRVRRFRPSAAGRPVSLTARSHSSQASIPRRLRGPGSTRREVLDRRPVDPGRRRRRNATRLYERALRSAGPLLRRVRGLRSVRRGGPVRRRGRVGGGCVRRGPLRDLVDARGARERGGPPTPRSSGALSPRALARRSLARPGRVGRRESPRSACWAASPSRPRPRAERMAVATPAKVRALARRMFRPRGAHGVGGRSREPEDGEGARHARQSARRRGGPEMKRARARVAAWLAWRWSGPLLTALVFVGGLVWRWLYLFRDHKPTDFVYSDMGMYVGLAKRFSKEGYALTVYDVTHPPGLSELIRVLLPLRSVPGRPGAAAVRGDRARAPRRRCPRLARLRSRQRALGGRDQQLYFPFIDYGGYFLAEIYITLTRDGGARVLLRGGQTLARAPPAFALGPRAGGRGGGGLRLLAVAAHEDGRRARAAVLLRRARRPDEGLEVAREGARRRHHARGGDAAVGLAGRSLHARERGQISARARTRPRPTS